MYSLYLYALPNYPYSHGATFACFFCSLSEIFHLPSLFLTKFTFINLAGYIFLICIKPVYEVFVNFWGKCFQKLGLSHCQRRRNQMASFSKVPNAHTKMTYSTEIFILRATDTFNWFYLDSIGFNYFLL